MTSVKTFLQSTAVAMALSVGALSAPADASVSTPFGSVNVGGFGIPMSWGGGNFGGFGLGNPNLGGGHWGGFGISTPWGGGSFGGFGLGNPNLGGGHWGGFGIGHAGFPGFPPPFIGGFGLNAEQALSIKTPFGSVHGPGFGVAAPWPVFGVSTPWGGGSFGGFGVGAGAQYAAPPFVPAFGISTPWGGISTPIFGLNGQPTAAQPQVLPVMVPYPVPMQGGASNSGAQPTQCMINAVPALTKSVDDCEKAGGAVPPTNVSAVQQAKK